MIRNTYAHAPDGVLSAYKDNAAVVAGASRARWFWSRSRDGRLRLRRRARAPRHEGRDAQSSDRDLAVPGRRDGVGRRDSRRGRDRPRREAESRAHGLHGLAPRDSRLAPAVGATRCRASPTGSRRRSRSCSTARSAPRASTTSSAGRISRATSAPRLLEADGAVARLSQADHDRGRPRQRAAAPTSRRPCPEPGAKLVVLGGPAMLIGLGGGAASSQGSGAGEADARLRVRAARQRRDAAACAGSHRRVLRRSGPAIRSRAIHDVGAGGLSNAVPEIVDHSGCGADHRSARDPERRARHEPDGAVVQRSRRSATCSSIAARDVERFSAICERERCPFAVIGELTAERDLIVRDATLGGEPVGDADGGAVRQAAEDDARRAPSRARGRGRGAAST